MSTRAYTVLSPVGADRDYAPGETIELGRADAAPLLDAGVLCDPDDPRAATAGIEPAPEAPAGILEQALDHLRQAPAEEVRDFIDRMGGDAEIRAKAEVGFERASAIADAYDKLAADKAASRTADGKLTVEALEAELGFDISAAERDAAHAAVEARG